MATILEREYTLNELDELAQVILEKISDYNFWLMNGQMGAGKTTLTQHLLKFMSTEEFKGSPTFSIVNVYHEVKKNLLFDKIYHFDLYRMNHIEEAWDIGIEEMWTDSSALSIVEWSEKASEILPKKCVSLNIEILSPDIRYITIKTDN